MGNFQPAPASTVVIDESVLDADELKQLAKWLDALMEIDFYLARNQEKATDD